MDLRDIAIAHLRRRRGKAALVVTGLAVAVATFVLVLSLILSLRGTMDDKLSRFGANMVVTPASSDLSLSYGGVNVAGAGSGQVRTLDSEAVAALGRVPSAAKIVAALPVLLEPVSVDGRTFLAMGTDVAKSLEVKPWWRIEGRAPARPDEVLLGLNVRNALGAEAGQRIGVRPQGAGAARSFTVAGVLQETGGEEDDLLVMPREPLAALSGREGEVNLVEVTAASGDAVDTLTKEIEAALPQASVSSVKQSIEFTNRANVSLERFGLAVSLLIVVIAGLVVTVTMLSSVRERQKEIGVLRAVGYKQSHVARLVLLESVVLSAGGAVVGLAVAIGVGLLVPRLVDSLSLRFSVQPLVVVAGVVLAFAVGMLASLYPARRAAGLDPVVALKYI